MTTATLSVDRATSSSARPVVTNPAATGLAATSPAATGPATTFRRVAAYLADQARRFASVVRATGARVAAVIAEQVGIRRTSVLPLVLAALVIVAIALQARRG